MCAERCCVWVIKCHAASSHPGMWVLAWCVGDPHLASHMLAACVPLLTAAAGAVAPGALLCRMAPGQCPWQHLLSVL
jgi:hypothetical protein